MIDFIQVGIGLTGGVAILLSQCSSPNVRRFACIFGLMGQPFWFWMAYEKQLWVLFFLNSFYAYSWSIGLYNNWIKGGDKCPKL
ncbi:hypothetical protein HOU12_gp49 [Dickeya phage Katbat]|uniref:Uncharacterized protein n=3 Tax=Aarhusvirus TaxID=2732675 RepID=A0A2S1GSH5_9CAUD|nr:hypothetical protein HOT15_gp50 [Dickeya phage Dagda]YP_009811917.1 hypothetical protein HOU12_gp49 [Dickeya phage Katbat]AWD92355.1 hypothetical protein [Dickeya phage Dagda]AXY81654.1 hypothetical protein [Dickeya phage Dagda_B1]AXY81766.1 hypothetical protein [Dickeya phage Katbat]